LEFSFVYLDRFKGLTDKQLGNLRSDVTRDDFVPSHRVWGLKYRGLVVWDRERRLVLWGFIHLNFYTFYFTFILAGLSAFQKMKRTILAEDKTFSF